MAKYNCAKFFGTAYQLQTLVREKAGIKGRWIWIDNNCIQFIPENGGNLQWWPSTRTAVVNGNWDPEEKARLYETITTLHPDWRKIYKKKMRAEAAALMTSQDNVDTLPPTDEVHDEPIIIPKEVLANVVQDSLSAL